MPKQLGQRNLTLDERRILVSLSTSGIPREEIAKHFNCSLRTVYRTIENSRARDAFEELPRSRRASKIDESVTNLGTYAGPLFFSPHDSFYSSFLLYLFGLPHLSTPVSQTHAY